MPNAVGILELSSIALGFELEDQMLKAAEVQLLVARTICSGKYLVVIGGDVGAVKASVAAAVTQAREGLIDQLVIPNVHASVFPAISGAAELNAKHLGALGVIETFSAASIIEAADAAVKTANVTLFRIHVAMAVGGKGYALLTGEVGACRAAVDAGAAAAARHGLLVNKVVIPGPSRELFREFI